jgi:arylsulfatase A-like enzyme
MKWTALQILALWTVAIVQPAFDLLGRSPEFFVAHQATPGDMWLLVTAFVLLVPLVLTGIVAAASLAGKLARTAALLFAVALLAAALVAQVCGRLGADDWPTTLAVSVAGGGTCAALFARVAVIRSFVSFLSIAALVVPAVFMTRPGVRSLVWPDQRAAFLSTDANRARNPLPVVLIVFDELPLLSLLDPSGTLDGQLYPNFTAVARDGVWFRNATTVSGYTRWALPAILTGQYPRLESVPSPADHPDTLFTLLAGTHSMEVSEAVTDLCPRELCHRPEMPRATRLRRMTDDVGVVLLHVVAPPDLRDRLPDVTRTWAGFVGNDGDERASAAWQARWARADSTNPEEIRRRPDVVRRFIDGISGADRQPTLYLLHSLVTHVPHLMLPSGQTSSTRSHIPTPAPSVGLDDEWAIAQQHQRHLLQVEFVDTLVGRLVARLKSEGLYDRALVILTADHGVAYAPAEPMRSITDANAAEVMRIPLLVKFPSTIDVDRHYRRDSASDLRVSDRNVETIDIVPTVAEVVAASVRWRVDGVSLLSPDPNRPRKRLADRTDRREYDSEGPSLQPALARKVVLFNGISNPFRVPRPPVFAHLVGWRAGDFHVDSSPDPVEVDQAWRYVHVDPRAPEVPFDISGRWSRDTSVASRSVVAVAVNGIIRAVTMTWKNKPREWAATVPLTVWRSGRNELEVFEVEGTPDRPRLRRLNTRAVRLGDLNLVTGEAERLWGVRMHGFYPSEGTKAASFRWTRGHATLIVPRAGARPHTLRLTVARGAIPNTHFTVRVNDCTLVDGLLTVPEREQILPLRQCALDGDEIRITLASNATRGPGRDRRLLGVAVRRVVLDDD